MTRNLPIVALEPALGGRVDERVDGRVARARRTRRAIVDALLALIEEGDVAPTAPRIAERAGVSLRSIYQHFEDLEALFAASSTRQIQRMQALVAPVDAGLPRAERVAAFTEQRARLLEAITPVRRAALLQEPCSPQLRRSREWVTAMAREEVSRLFRPELDAVGPDERAELLAAIDAVAGWSMWDSLRTSDVAADAARRVMAKTIDALLAASTTTQS